MAKSIMRLDTGGFDHMLETLDKLGGDMREAVDAALDSASIIIAKDTLVALAPQNLPACGKYSSNPSKTRESVILDAKVEWQGDVASIPIGFDFSKPGAGGYLISGTPKMKPAKELHRMYKEQTYMKSMMEKMSNVIMWYIRKAMG